MADQDFNIKVVTTADTTGIRQTEAELTKLQRQQATFAETARRQQAAAIAAAKPAPAVSETVGVTGTAVGLGTIVTLLTASLSKWRDFNAEQDKWVDGMIKSQEKSRELGLAVADMLDAMKSAERIETEPLQDSFDRLTQKVKVLKQEMQLAFAAGAYDDVKRLAAALGVVESQVDRVTAAIERQAATEKKAAADRDKATEKRLSEEREFTGKALESSSAQTKAILENEDRARKASAAGDDKSADQFQRTADQLKKSATQGQLDEYEQLKKALFGEGRPGRKAGVGESQEAVDQIERNRRAFERGEGSQDFSGQSEETKQVNAELRKRGEKPITEAQKQNLDVVMAIRDLETKFDRYWS